ncbi:MAG: EAL domain-containing protein [Methylobacter sp.]|jgi:diguanylate cyclase (GGDEF)-like protein/PAS domain S-box-containing protein|nr:EAL domain-containing protein [Methylobacter sp.]
MSALKKADYFNTSLAEEMDSSFQQHSLFVNRCIQLNHASALPQIGSSVYQCFFEHSSDAMLIADADCKILHVNPAFVAITGYSLEESIGQTPHLLSFGAHSESFYDLLWESLNQKGYWRGELVNKHKNGDLFSIWQRINVIEDDNRQVLYYISAFSDISIIKETERKLWQMAHLDSLSGLANRALFEQRLLQEIFAAKRSGQFGAVIFLDLDDFKKINDCLGHRCGDLLLQEVAKRLQTNLRTEDTVARLGGDEFVILLSGLTHKQEDAEKAAGSVAEKVLDALLQVYFIDSQELQISASLGITLFSTGFDESTEKLLRQADVAMYAAKTEGKSTYCFYHPGMLEQANKRLSIENELRSALQNDQIVLFYQPQYDFTHRLLGFEALVRWQHPDQGMISPADFLPVAEETGIIIELGERLLYMACRQLAAWHSQGFDVPHLAINISPVQFNHCNFIDSVIAALELTGVNPSSVMLEITENLIIKDINEVIEKMQLLKQRGIRFSIDDFGTGYSSLAYLQRMPIDQLKIDRSFVQDITRNENDAAIVNAIIAMAGSLKLDIIAEGVETPEQVAYLADCGCNAFQGYWFSRPLPGAEVLSKLDKG